VCSRSGVRTRHSFCGAPAHLPAASQFSLPFSRMTPSR
jgi:hypothetical protein